MQLSCSFIYLLNSDGRVFKDQLPNHNGDRYIILLGQMDTSVPLGNVQNILLDYNRMELLAVNSNGNVYRYVMAKCITTVVLISPNQVLCKSKPLRIYFLQLRPRWRQAIRDWSASEAHRRAVNGFRGSIASALLDTHELSKSSLQIYQNVKTIAIVYGRAIIGKTNCNEHIGAGAQLMCLFVEDKYVVITSRYVVNYGTKHQFAFL